MSFHYRYRKQIIIISVITIILIGVISLGVYFYLNDKPKEKNSTKTDNIIIEKKKEKKIEEVNDIFYQVDIKGEVNNPGIYSLKEDSRVIDVINVAGGLTENANTNVINLSKKISDEMVIIIYSNNEVEDFKKTKEIEKQVISSCIQTDENALYNDACINIEENNVPTGKISINTASKEDFMTLPGVGEAKAQSIIDYRNEFGPFESIEDILNVSGIGDNLFAQIKEYLTT